MSAGARGLGLVELLFLAMISAVLASSALAGFGPLVDRMKVAAAAGDFRAALMQARSEAIRRGRRVDLLPAVKGDWAAGWAVVIDANDNQAIDAGEQVLRLSPSVAGLDVSARLSDRRHAYLAFDPAGRPSRVGSALQPQFGTLSFRVGDQQRKLVISFLGRARICDPARNPGTC